MYQSLEMHSLHLTQGKKTPYFSEESVLAVLEYKAASHVSLIVLHPDQFSHLVSTQGSYSTEIVKKGNLLPAALSS